MKHKEYKKLHAEWYEYVAGEKDHREEIDFWARNIESAGEPALELGSGTGRVFVPLLERGYDIVGIDTSEDMTTRCLAACKTKGLKAELHEQSMLEFDLSREFSLIFLDSGGLGLFISDQDILALFARVMAHLKPGGMFIYEFQPLQTTSNTWDGNWVKGPGNVTIAWRQRYKYDCDTHVWRNLFIVEKFLDGCLVETEANERWGRFFTVDEAVQYARTAGFKDIIATNWLSEDPPGKDSKVITVRCRKPANLIGPRLIRSV